MIVQCPNCGTKYNLSENLLRPEGSKVRCTRCTHVFQVRPTSSEDAVVDQLLENKAAATQADWAEHQSALKDLEGTFQPPLLSHETEKPPRLDLAGKATAQKPRVWMWGAVIMMVLVLLAGGGLVLLRPAWLPWLAPKPTSQEVPPARSSEEVARIVLENVRQYFVTNEKAGQLFVIEGLAVNRFPEPRELIKLKAALFNAQGGEVASQEFLAGNTVTLYQLQVASRQEIEAALSAKVGVLTNNTNVQPGRGVPFMVVFFGVPAGVQEFGLEVVQAKTPPK